MVDSKTFQVQGAVRKELMTLNGRLSSMSSPPPSTSSSINLDLLRNMLLGFKSACIQILPKVNPTLIADIIER
jgi:hypothetical protein